MGIVITIYLDKNITRSQIKEIFDSKLPDDLKCKYVNPSQEWGLIYEMDIYVKETDNRNFIVLHAAQGYDYRSFLLCSIDACLQSGYKIIDIDYSY